MIDRSVTDCPGAAEFRSGLTAFSERRIPAALDSLDRAQRAGYDADQCSAQRWYCYMLMGRFEEAWQESDRIAARGNPDPYCLWNGTPFSGKRVIIRCLHGLGDAIQFVRYARLVRREASRVIVETHAELLPLFGGIPFIDDVITWAGTPQSLTWDVQVEVMELPKIYRSTLSTLPCDTPYIFPDSKRVAAVEAALGARKKPRIGLVWAASDWNPFRNVPLAALLPILRLPGFDFYSFQYGPHREELSQLTPRIEVHDVIKWSEEIADTAAALMSMDLLISADTMAAHLGGALGRTVWTLLYTASDWRWMLYRPDSPWYPAMRLFRQETPGDWEAPVQQMLRRLESDSGSLFANNPANAPTLPFRDSPAY
ncbi:MAG: hypothetical protein U0Q18_26815 [Bryobacteraceae bacterium]